MNDEQRRYALNVLNDKAATQMLDHLQDAALKRALKTRVEAPQQAIEHLAMVQAISDFRSTLQSHQMAAKMLAGDGDG